MHLDPNSSLITSTFCTSEHQAQAQHTPPTHGLTPLTIQTQPTSPPPPPSHQASRHKRHKKHKTHSPAHQKNDNNNNNHLPTGVPVYLTTTTAPTPPSHRPSSSLPQPSSSASYTPSGRAGRRRGRRYVSARRDQGAGARGTGCVSFIA